MAKSAQITPPQKNSASEPSYLATDWTYGTEISLVDGHWRWKHNAKGIFIITLFLWAKKNMKKCSN